MKFQKYIDEQIQYFEAAKDRWNYEDGCVLSGASYLYEVTGDEKYKNFVLEYLKDYISPEGIIRGFHEDEYNLDSIKAGSVLFDAMEWEPEDPRYKLAADALRKQLESQPRLEIGNFWHKLIYPYQIWLDGLYMAQPFYTTYETKFNSMAGYRDITSQFKNVRETMFVEDKKLYIHCYDEKREQPWADKETGKSPNFWLRAMGWFFVALVDTYDEISETIFEAKEGFISQFQEAIEGILPYADPETGLYYDLVDLPEVEGNYLESSGSVMIAYSLLKACRLGMIDREKYWDIAMRILRSLDEKFLNEENGRLQLENCCSVSGLGPGDKRDGSVAYYLSEPIVNDDHKAVGALMMAWSEVLRNEKAQ